MVESHKPLVIIVGILVKIRTEHLLNTIQTCYHLGPEVKSSKQIMKCEI
jgi:hypothetical protein